MLHTLASIVENLFIASSHIVYEITINIVNVTLGLDGTDLARGSALDVLVVSDICCSIYTPILSIPIASVGLLYLNISAYISTSLPVCLAIGYATSLINPRSLMIIGSISLSLPKSSFASTDNQISVIMY